MTPATGFELRPYTLSELLDLTFRVYRRGFRVNAKIGMLVSVTAMGLALTWQVVFFRSIGPDTQPETLFPILLIPGLVFLLLGTSVLSSLGIVSISVAAEDVLAGRVEGLRSVLARAAPRMPAGAWTGLLSSVAILLGMCLCCAPGIVLFVLFALAIPLTYFEGLSGRAAIRRSYELVVRRGPADFSGEANWARVFILALVSLLTMYALNALASAPVLALTGVHAMRGSQPYMTPLGPLPVPLWLYLPIRLLAAIGEGVLIPISMIPWPLLYHDIRIRHEGLDIGRRLRAMDPAAFPAERP